MNEYLSYRLAAFLSRSLPERLAYWLGLRIADGFCRRNQAGRDAVMSNIRQIYEHRGVVAADDALTGLARKTFQYFGKYLVDFFRYARLTEAELKKRVSIEHPEYLRECLNRGKGVLLVTAHFGNWEIGGAVVAAMGHRVNAVVLPQRLERLNRMLQRMRERRGLHLIPVGHAALNVMRCLRKGEIVALLGDRDFTAKDERVPFFGKPARIPRGPAWLCVKTGAPVLPSFLLRQVDDTFLLRFRSPIVAGPGESVESVQARICRVLEQEIAEHPYQWFIFDDFWAERTSDFARVAEVA